MVNILTAKPLIESSRLKLAAKAIEFLKKHSRKPRLDVVLVGDDPASHIYTSNKKKTAFEIGFESHIHLFNSETDPTVVRHFIEKLNADPNVDGILIQRPVPKTFEEDKVAYWVSPEKDVDAFHPDNVGRLALGLSCLESCTPAGIMRLLDFYKINVKGMNACVVGRSNIVGKPMGQMLLRASATVTMTHSQTKNIEHFTKFSDLVILAAGKPKYFNASFFNSNAVVIDVGIHRDEKGKLCGDADFESVSRHVKAITPVPGGVGPMTIDQLMWNTITAAERRESTRGS